MEAKYAGMSPYNYGFNNPLTFNDPSGMEGNDAVENTVPYKTGVIPYDYAEWKGWSPPEGSASLPSKSFKAGNYTITPYFNTDDKGNAIGDPLYYTAAKQVDIMEGAPENGGRTILKDKFRTDFLIMPWAIEHFKEKASYFEASSDLLHFSGFGQFPAEHLNLSTLKILEGNYLGAVGEQWKGALKDPMFYLGAAISIGELSKGSISASPKTVRNKVSSAAAGDLATQAEMRVADAYRKAGSHVELIDSNLGHATGSGTYDMTIDGVKTDVKRLSGLGPNAAGDIKKGAIQVGPGGQVIVVRPEHSKFTFQQYSTFIKNFKSPIPNVRIRLVNESSLPKLKL